MSVSAKIILLLAVAFLVSCLIISTTRAEDTSNTASNAPTGTVEPEIRSDTVGSATDATNEEALQKLNEAMKSADKHQFQAEINQLLGIIINSLYTNKEIFLRELISNASDAIDKLRFMSLTDKKVLESNPDLKIEVIPNAKANTLTIRDTGIGMTRQDLVNNLGTIARSGTKAFLEKLQSSKDSMNLIGQFGVGFYSAFLVADTVTVVTKHNDDKQLIWQSKADNTFLISEDPRGNTLGRGTELILSMKDDAKEFLDETKLKNLITTYSEFIQFPIYLYTTKNETKEVPIIEDVVVGEEKKAEEAKAAETKADDEVKVEEAKKEEEKPKTKTVTETKQVFELLNENKPIWTRNPSEVSREEYTKFYKAISKDVADFLTHIHFTAEGNVDFKSILYVPEHAPANLLDLTQKTNNVKLYVKRVFITDQLNDLIPRYLNFLRGIVDSDDLPLNVSREQLQHSKLLKAIKKKLVQKAISMFVQLAEKEAKAKEGDAEASKDDGMKYSRFWKEFGKNIKLGIIEDEENRRRLTKLVRYYSTKSEFQLTSLDDYVKRMKPNQKNIYFIAGESQDELRKSPFLEELNKRDLEVLYFTDAIDEYTVQQIKEYEGKELISITREDLKLGDDQNEKEKEALKKRFEPLTNFIKEIMGQKIIRADVGSRFTSSNQSPCVLVATKFGYTANMVRIMKAQTLGTQEQQMMNMFVNAKIVEINPHHPVIVELNRRIEKDKSDATAKGMVELLYETASLRSGYQIDDAQMFADRIFNMLKTGLHLDEQPADSQSSEQPSTSTTSADTTASASAHTSTHDEL